MSSRKSSFNRGRALPDSLSALSETDTALLPPTAAVIEAGAFGAAMGGIGTGISESMAVRAGERTREEAVSATARGAVQGALTMSVASVVAHVVRVQPLFGLGLLAVIGLGAFKVMGGAKKNAPVAESSKA